MAEGEPNKIEQKPITGPEQGAEGKGTKKPAAEIAAEKAKREARERELRARDIAERERVLREELLADGGRETAEETAKGTAGLVHEAYPFGKAERNFIKLGIPESEEPGDPAAISIINAEGEELLNLRELVPAGTEFAASSDSRVPEYDYAEKRVYLPVLNKSFARNADKKLLGILHAIGHARRSGEPDEERARMMDLQERDGYDKLLEEGTEEARREYDRISEEAREARRQAEEEAWQEALAIIEKYIKEKGLDLVPGYGDLKEGEAVKKKVWLEIQRHMDREEALGAGGESLGERFRALFAREGLKRGLRQSKNILKKAAIGAVVVAVVAGVVLKWTWGLLREMWSESAGGAGAVFKAKPKRPEGRREK